MATYRNVSMSFWTDAKVVDDFTPEDRYFYIYLFTNPHTNLCGCYEISVRQIANEIGYGKNVVENFIDRFQKVHKVIAYSQETKEILLLNWSKYNWIQSEKFQKALSKEVSSVKDQHFREYLEKVMEGDDVSIPYPYGIDKTVTVSVKDTVMDTVKEESSEPKKQYPYTQVIGYLNEKTGKHFMVTTKDARKLIRARFDEGRTLDDFKKVIDNMCAKWKGDPKMDDFLRPLTLFGPKFESYLNCKVIPAKPSNENKFNFKGRDIDYDELERQLLQG